MLLSSCVNPPPRPTESGPAVNTAALDRMLARQWQATGLPGMAVVVARGDDVVYLGGFGSDGHGHGRAVTADTLFMIASLTKSFTAVAVLQLVEKRKVVSDRWFTR